MENLNSVIVTLVLKMKEIVMLMMSVKMVLDVQAVQRVLDSVQICIVAHALISVEVLNGKGITTVMIKTTIVDVNGMEETVVVAMLTQIFVQLANVLIQLHQDQEKNKI